MKLFYYPKACSLADHIALIECGLPYKLCSIKAGNQTEDSRDFLSINPKGYTPALELQDGAILTENQTILTYIAETSGKLLPREGIARWRVLEALAYMSSEIHGNYTPFFRNFTEIEKARAREKIAKAFAILEIQMGDNLFLVSDVLTIADCYLFWILMVAPRSGVQLPVRLRNYFDRMVTRPAVVLAFSEEGLIPPERFEAIAA